jgi:hypothetical protein
VSDDAPIDDSPGLLNFVVVVSRISCRTSFLP